MNIFIIQIYILIIHINYIQFTAVKLNQLMLTNCSCTVGWGFDRTNTACVVGEIRISVDQTVEASSAVMCHHRHTCSSDVLRMSLEYLICFFNLLYVPYPFISSWYVAYRDYLHQYIVISGIRYILAAGLGSWIWRTVALSWMSGLKSHAASPRYGTLPTFGAKIKVMLSNATMPGHRCFETLQSTEFPHCYQTSLSGAPELRTFESRRNMKEQSIFTSTNSANAEKFRDRMQVDIPHVRISEAARIRSSNWTACTSTQRPGAIHAIHAIHSIRAMYPWDFMR